MKYSRFIGWILDEYSYKMTHARVEGESHCSDSDLDNVLSVDFSDYDAVFVEHHNDPEYKIGLRPGLLLFVVSFLTYGVIISKTYHTYQRIEDECEEYGVCFENDIDLDFIETYRELRWVWKLIIPIGVLGVSITFGTIISVYLATINLAVSHYLILCAAVLVFVISFVLLENAAVEAFGTYPRERAMVREILKRSDKKGYNNILIVCGDSHRLMIGYLLQLAGWDVDQTPTNSRLRYIYKPILYTRLFVLKNIRRPSSNDLK